MEPVLTSHQRGVAPTRDDCLTEVKKQWLRGNKFGILATDRMIQSDRLIRCRFIQVRLYINRKLLGWNRENFIFPKPIHPAKN